MVELNGDDDNENFISGTDTEDSLLSIGGGGGAGATSQSKCVSFWQVFSNDYKNPRNEEQYINKENQMDAAQQRMQDAMLYTGIAIAVVVVYMLT